MYSTLALSSTECEWCLILQRHPLSIVESWTALLAEQSESSQTSFPVNCDANFHKSHTYFLSSSREGTPYIIASTPRPNSFSQTFHPSSAWGFLASHSKRLPVVTNCNCAKCHFSRVSLPLGGCEGKPSVLKYTVYLLSSLSYTEGNLTISIFSWHSWGVVNSKKHCLLAC